GRRVVRAGTARRVPLRDADERAVRGGAGTLATRAARRYPRRDGSAAAAAQTLSVVLFDASGQRRHGALQARRARLPARLLPPQERRLAAEPAAPLGGVDGGRAGEDANLLHHGSERDDGRDGGA